MNGLMHDIRIITETESVADTSLLHRLWADLPSFAFVPDKSGVTDQWLLRALDIVPAGFRDGCFGILTSGSTGEPS